MIFINKFFEQKYLLCFKIFCFKIQSIDNQGFEKLLKKQNYF